MGNALTIPREKLFQGDWFEGIEAASNKFLERIQEHGEYKERAYVEEDPSYKQPIAYAIIINKEKQQILFYQRPAKNPTQDDYKEKRHAGNTSIGVGGHCDKVDEGKNYVEAALLRELEEEVGITDAKVKHLAYLNTECDTFNSVHFGVIFTVETDDEVKETEEVLNPKWVSWKDADKHRENSEKWTQMIIDQLTDEEFRTTMFK